MSEEIVTLKNVWVSYNEYNALEDVSLSIGKNDFLAVIGVNGGGKTTLLKVILGLIHPSKGQVKIFGQTPEKSREFIGYLPQYTFFDLNFPITVLDVVLMGRLGRKMLFKNYSSEDRQAAMEALSLVKMSEFKDRKIGSLSGGQLQRVFIARALVKDPRLLLLDEPTASVDQETQRSLYDFLLEIKKKMAIVIVSHDIGVVSSYVDKVACLNRRLFYHGSVEGALERLEDIYQCPVEVLAHGIPHRVLGRHEE